MPIKKISGRQGVIAATADFKFSELASGVYAPAVDVPGGAIVVGGHLAITEVFNSATDDKFSIGDQEGSDAAAEFNEIDLKLKTILSAFEAPEDEGDE